MASDGEDSHWEYEYDETETEDFHITVELATKTQSLTDKSGETDDDLGVVTPLSKRQKTASPSPSPNPRESQVEDAQDVRNSNLETSLVQVANLHDPNPVIFMGGQLYSCNWNEILGTAMIFAAKDTADRSPVTSTSNFDLVGTTSLKLTGLPVTPVYRRTGHTASRMSSQLDQTDANSFSRAKAAENQRAFLHRLRDVKARKRESDLATVHALCSETDFQTPDAWPGATFDMDPQNESPQRAPSTPIISRRGRGRGHSSRPSDGMGSPESPLDIMPSEADVVKERPNFVQSPRAGGPPVGRRRGRGKKRSRRLEDEM